jgi:hypothetical protein
MRRSLPRAAAVAAITATVAVACSAVPAGAAEPTPPPRDISRFACPPASVPEDGFVDTAGDFEDEIDCLAWYGITTGGPQGLPANQYGPTLSVTRAQMASFLARFLDHVDPAILPAYDGQNEFTDVAADNPHVGPINRLADADIVTGGAGGAPATTYAPDAAVTRDQMASFIARTLGVVLEANLCVNVRNYFDDDAGNTHEPCINGLADIAVVAGTAAGVYSPATAVSRAQMAAFLMRAMDLLVEQELAAPPSSA